MIEISPCPIVIEELTEQYLQAVIQMDQNCLGGLWTEAGYRREIESPNSQLLIIRMASKTLNKPSEPPLRHSNLIGIGCVWFILEEAHITLLAIKAPYRRQGFGQILLMVLLETSIQRQSQWATLEVRCSNRPAQQLYEKFGFITIGQRKKYYQDTGEDALILWNKELQKPVLQYNLAQIKQKALERLHINGWCVESLRYNNCSRTSSP
ncbi:MAG: ribosomal protein S18-alanine N-acetyltransferase [Cyanobacteria bacterium P01_F01_bin.150]